MFCNREWSSEFFLTSSSDAFRYGAEYRKHRLAGLGVDLVERRDLTIEARLKQRKDAIDKEYEARLAAFGTSRKQLAALDKAVNRTRYVIKTLFDWRNEQFLVTKKMRDDLRKILAPPAIAATPAGTGIVTYHALKEQLRAAGVTRDSLTETLERLVKEQKQLSALTKPLQDLHREQMREIEAEALDRKNKRAVESAPCPDPACRGYVELGLASTYLTCSLCDAIVCARCTVVVPREHASGHVCKTEDMESIRFKELDTRPCPNPSCSAQIHKISGCDQMFCTHCHASFSWKTGALIDQKTRVIHNPHYMEHMAHAAANEADDSTYPRVIMHLQSILPSDVRHDPINHILSLQYSTIDTRIQSLHRQLERLDRSVHQLRIKRINGAVDDDAFRRELYSIDVRRTANLAYIDIFTDIKRKGQIVVQGVLKCTDATDLDTEVVEPMARLYEEFNARSSRVAAASKQRKGWRIDVTDGSVVKA